MTAVVLLAAGRGVRMRSSRPKVLHEAAGRPLLDRALDIGARPRGCSGHRRRGRFEGRRRRRRVSWRRITRGSGSLCRTHRAAPATRCAPPRRRAPSASAKTVVVLSGDVPLLSADAVKGLVDALKEDKKAAVAVLTATLANPTGYGRIVRDKRKSFREDKRKRKILRVKRRRSGRSTPGRMRSTGRFSRARSLF